MLTYYRTLTKSLLSVAVCVFASSASMAQTANLVTLSGQLSGASEVPANASAGAGSVAATLNKENNELKWTVNYSGLSGPALAGHFHGPAAAGQNAGVALGFKGSVESPIMGQATLTPEQVQDLLAGKWYVNVHTKANPGGELRAQVVPAN